MPGCSLELMETEYVRHKSETKQFACYKATTAPLPFQELAAGSPGLSQKQDITDEHKVLDVQLRSTLPGRV